MGRPRKDIFVKVARIGGEAVEVCLNTDRTVADALDAAALTLKASEDVRVNGSKADEDTELLDGDRVTVIKQVAGAN